MAEAFNAWLKAHALIHNLSSTSQAQYASNFRILTDKAGLRLLKDSQDKIIASLKELGYKPATQRTILSLACAYRDSECLPIAKIQFYRRRIQRDQGAQKSEVNAKKASELPSPKELLCHELEKYEEGEYAAFIVCHLLRLLHCRNLDLQLCLTRDRNLANKCPDGHNYLIVDDKRERCTVLRRRYKTAGTYGPKRRFMCSGKLFEAASGLLAEKDHHWLLIGTKSNKVKDSELCRAVRSHTYKNLSEGDYNKVHVSAVKEVKDFGKLAKISEQRGTDISSLLDYYHTDSAKPWFSTSNSKKN